MTPPDLVVHIGGARIRPHAAGRAVRDAPACPARRGAPHIAADEFLLRRRPVGGGGGVGRQPDAAAETPIEAEAQVVVAAVQGLDYARMGRESRTLLR